MARAHLEVTGAVQGVGFRWFVRQHARALGLAGWVRNEDSGAVRVAVEGSDDAVAELVELIRPGPPGARVDGIRRVPPTEDGDLPQPFTVIR